MFSETLLGELDVVGIASPPAVLFPDGQVLTPSIEAAEALQGFEKGWTTPAADMGRNLRWRLVGNAVSVPVASWAVRQIVKAASGVRVESGPLDNRWPNAAYGASGMRAAIRASERPLGLTPSSLAAFRDENWKPLSFRALNGFLSRAEEGGLSFPQGFLDALRLARERAKAL